MSLAAIVLAVLRPATARADQGGYGEWTLDARLRWMPHLPRVAVRPPNESDTYDGPVTRIPDGKTTLGDGGTFLGGAFSYDWVIADRLKIPFFGVAGGAMIGSQPRVVGAIDGSIVTARPARAGFVTILLPGIGVRRNVRRWSFGAEARFGLSVVFAPVEVAQGTSSSSFTATAIGLALLGELQACRRLDPLQRVCLFVAPSLYEYGWLNGGTAGLRWEIAP